MNKPTHDQQVYSPATQPPSGGSGSGFPWGKVLAGCGCLTVLLMFCAGGAVFFMIQKGSEFAEENGLKDIAEMIEEMEGGSGSSGSGGPLGGAESGNGEGSADIQREARQRKEDALDVEKIRAYINEPLTKKDIREHHEFVEEWKSDPAYKNWVEQFEKMKELNKKKDESVTGNLKAIGQSAKWMNAAKTVMEAFDKKVREEEGGYEKYYGRLMRIGGVVAASDTITKSNRKLKDANSDAVAKRMLEERPEIAKQYKKNLAEAKKAVAEAEKRKKAGQEPNPGDMAALGGLMTIMQGPGTVALARMPEGSFETWKKLSPEERKKLRESLTDSIAPGPYFGLFAVNPAGLIMTAYMAELDELKPDK
ncbi:hypothetical protein FIV42_03100 [Persicimonas caeni]|uniref:Uncharacterized protein n=1 Tax=Persicimonas caeni TaxID=2292766 RepID=A0A4Y6PN68_PERCE|nr:hypothetical protein [Persicimonas caeni]QDG49758.1 hypothetical protein FIV42_03100 [Persicimonas caeni]QED30979.1 hypothetical protein FRD00_03095 [Persicimonas caeni]